MSGRDTIGRGGLAVLAAVAALAAAQPVYAHGGRHGAPPAAGARGKPKPATSVTVPAALGTQTKGVVQRVTARVLVLKQLDGAAVTVPINRRTQVFVDGKPGRLGDVRPGFVVTAAWDKSGKVATLLLFLRPG